jgi:Protein of unknown function (DUF3011)
MKTSIVCIAAGLCVSAGLLSQTAVAREHDVRLIRCEAEGHGDDYCSIDTRGGVRLVRQISGASCVQNRSWGFDDGGIWVRNGCGAEFEVVEAERDHGHHRDRDDERQADRRASRDEDQDEDQNEDQGQGQDEDRGDQDENRHAANQREDDQRDEGQRDEGQRDENQQDDERDNPRERHHEREAQRSHGAGVSVTCQSHDYGYQYCAIHVRRGAELVRQLSGSTCVSNESWGFDRDGVWVDKGCAAEFVVH